MEKEKGKKGRKLKGIKKIKYQEVKVKEEIKEDHQPIVDDKLRECKTTKSEEYNREGSIGLNVGSNTINLKSEEYKKPKFVAKSNSSQNKDKRGKQYEKDMIELFKEQFLLKIAYNLELGTKKDIHIHSKDTSWDNLLNFAKESNSEYKKYPFNCYPDFELFLDEKLTIEIDWPLTKISNSISKTGTIKELCIDKGTLVLGEITSTPEPKYLVHKLFQIYKMITAIKQRKYDYYNTQNYLILLLTNHQGSGLTIMDMISLDLISFIERYKINDNFFELVLRQKQIVYQGKHIRFALLSYHNQKNFSAIYRQDKILKSLETKMNTMVTYIEELKEETKTEIKELKEETKTEIKELKEETKEMKTDIKELKEETKEMKKGITELKTEFEMLNQSLTRIKELLETIKEPKQ